MLWGVMKALKMLIPAASVISLIVVAGLLLLYLSQGLMLFPGQSTRGRIPSELPPDAEELQLIGPDGKALYGVYLRSPASRNGVVFFQGNAECIAYSLPDLEDLRGLGLHVVMIDYPGYGGSEGSPSSDALKALAPLALEQLRKRTEVTRIFVAGRSIGTGPACHIASTEEVSGLILLAGFTDLQSLARQALPIGPAARLLRHEFDNRAAIGRVRAPLLIYHNQDDEIIPVAMAHELQAAAAGPVQLVIGPTGGHNGIRLGPGTPAGEAIAAFVR